MTISPPRVLPVAKVNLVMISPPQKIPENLGGLVTNSSGFIFLKDPKKKYHWSEERLERYSIVVAMLLPITDGLADEIFDWTYPMQVIAIPPAVTQIIYARSMTLPALLKIAPSVEGYKNYEFVYDTNRWRIEQSPFRLVGDPIDVLPISETAWYTYPEGDDLENLDITTRQQWESWNGYKVW